MPEITREAALKEWKRELAVRQKVYPGWVAQGKLTQATADHRIACVVFTIKELEQGLEESDDRKQLDLFGGAE